MFADLALGLGHDAEHWKPFRRIRSILAVDRFHLRKSAFICGLTVFCSRSFVFIRG